MKNISSEQKRSIIILAAIVLSFPILLMIYYVDPAQIRIFGICPIYQATGLLCPSCGMTRALHNLLHLRFTQAWRYNPLIYVLILVSIGLCYNYLTRAKRNMFENKRITMALIITVLVVIVIYSVARNINI